MKIEKLISVFERLLPIYKEAYNKKFKELPIPLFLGLCNAASLICYEDIYFVFYKEGYYGKLVDDNHNLFPYPNNYSDLISRIDFMESEIKDLKRLIKKGYTHV